MPTKLPLSIQWILTSLVGFLFIIIPLLYSGRTLESLIILELVALICLLITGWFTSWKNNLSILSIILLFSFAFIPIIYLIPLPYDLWIQLPGRTRYQGSIEWLSTEVNLNPTPYLALSIIPYKTAHTLLAMLPLIAVTLVTASLNFSFRHKLVVLFLILASFQAVLALVQFTNPNAEWLKWLNADTGRSSQGTYRNRDHLATFMVITMPMAIGLTLYSIGLKKSSGRTEESNEWRIATALLYLFLLLLVFTGAVFTRSRAGVMLAILALLITLPVFAPHLGGRKTLGITASILGLGAAITASIGLIPVLNRFILSNAAEDERWRMFAITKQAIQEFFPLGSGPSTFQEIYRGFQPIEQLAFINHAHNDYLELILETGAIGIAILVLTLIVYIMGWAAMWGTKWDRERIIKTAAGIGILLFMIHASMEFTSHTPANAMFLAFLGGLFLKLPNQSQLAGTK